MRVPPVPIPNTEVKPHRAESTWRATAWEDRSSPGLFLCLYLYCKCSSKKFLCPRVCIIDARVFFWFWWGAKAEEHVMWGRGCSFAAGL